MKKIDAGTALVLAGSLRKPLCWLAIVFIAILGAAAVILTVASHAGTNAPMRPGQFAFLIGATSLGVVAWRTFHAGVSIERDRLVVRTGFGTKRLALANLRPHGVKLVDLTREKRLRPLWRLWGTSLPGLSTGWFRLRNGEKAVCLILDQQRVCYLRSDADDLSLLLSLRDPAQLSRRLER